MDEPIVVFRSFEPEPVVNAHGIGVDDPSAHRVSVSHVEWPPVSMHSPPIHRTQESCACGSFFRPDYAQIACLPTGRPIFIVVNTRAEALQALFEAALQTRPADSVPGRGLLV
jgi:hypothetical protein